MTAKPEIDEVTGAETTGHEWDGIKELNKPLPKWWLYVLYATIIWSVGYWIAYPAWPLLSGYTVGMLGHTQRREVAANLEQAKAGQAGQSEALVKASLADIKADPKLFEVAMASGRTAFGDNCAPCHGRGAQGAKGYPNLNDDEWLWGGKLDAIHETIGRGIRAGAKDTRQSAMPRFGLDGMLQRAEIGDIADYLLSLSGQKADGAAAERGKALYDENCVTCHGESAKGNQEVGAPDLTDAIWLYGGAKADIVRSIETGRGGVMPAWAGRLDGATIKTLAIYVHSLGGGK